MRIINKALVIGVAAGVVVAGAGIGFAATGSTSKTVKACATSTGRLALLSSSGKCPKGFAVVTINKQGARGATGPKGPAGPKGAPGAAGPGAKKLYLRTSGSGATPAVTIGSFSYSMGCDVTDSTGGTASATVTLYVAPVAGVSGSINTFYSFTNDAAPTPTVRTYHVSFGTETPIFASVSPSHYASTYFDAMRVVGSDGTVQLVSFDSTVDGRASASDRCAVNGVVVPSS